MVKLASNSYPAQTTLTSPNCCGKGGHRPSRPTVRRISVKAGIGSPRSRRSQQRRSTAATLGWSSGDPSRRCSSPWTTPPVWLSRPSSAPARTPTATLIGPGQPNRQNIGHERPATMDEIDANTQREGGQYWKKSGSQRMTAVPTPRTGWRTHSAGCVGSSSAVPCVGKNTRLRYISAWRLGTWATMFGG